MGIPGLKKLLCDFRRHGICKAMELWQPNNTNIWHGYGGAQNKGKDGSELLKGRWN